MGLPVYNGERFLGEALESILSQSWTDLEVVISDNASTDRTPDICSTFAARDGRIRYRRNTRNLGAAPNYNLTFQLSSGDYFKWAAHDDVLGAHYIERCVSALESDPGAIGCQSVIRYIDEGSQELGIYDSRLTGSGAPGPSTRFAAWVLRPHPCNEFFGVIRRSALDGSLLHASFHGADRALLAQLALRGRFIQLREPLLCMREHATRYTKTRTRPQDRQLWHDTSLGGRHSLPTWRLYQEYWRLCRHEDLPAGERLACAGHLLRWWWHSWNAARMGVDVMAVAWPGGVRVAEEFKQRHIATAPGYGAYGRDAYSRGSRPPS